MEQSIHIRLEEGKISFDTQGLKGSDAIAILEYVKFIVLQDITEKQPVVEAE
jgi:hypothetical protein